MAENFPEFLDTRSLRADIDDGFNWVVANYDEALEVAFLPALKLLVSMEQFLQWLPWYVTLSALTLLTYLTCRNWKPALGTACMMFLIGVAGVWDAAMITIALMLASAILAVMTGIPIGVLMSRSNTMQRIMLPVLDIMQTMPIFVYLIPFVMLFGPGRIPALLATIVFTVPPVIRLTNLGVRQVDREIVEGVTSFGATPLQRLMTAQIPLAMPTIMAGINQTTMLALSMVVIASMIGAGGLGYQVLQGIRRLEVSRGLFAGLGIVFLAIIFDRIAQAHGRRMQQRLRIQP